MPCPFSFLDAFSFQNAQRILRYLVSSLYFGIYRKAVVYPSPVSQRQFAELVMVKLHVTKGRSADPEGLGCFSLRYAGGCVPSRLCFSKGTAAEILDQKRTGRTIRMYSAEQRAKAPRFCELRGLRMFSIRCCHAAHGMLLVWGTFDWITDHGGRTCSHCTYWPAEARGTPR